MEPIHKFNNGDGATLCNICNTIITPFLTDELYCDKHKNMDKKDIIEVANSFLSYEEMYELLNNGDFSFLSRELNTNRYPQIEWMIEYFENKEDYEKCDFLSKLQIPN